ncbi:MAG: ATP-binding protein [Gemmataceae bacterium]
MVVVSVRDSGIGIPPGALASIFDMLSHVDRSVEQATGGLGIGLALVKGLVEMHSGTVTAHSEGVVKESTFTVTLPVLADHSEGDDHTSSQEPMTERRRILVVATTATVPTA